MASLGIGHNMYLQVVSTVTGWPGVPQFPLWIATTTTRRVVIHVGHTSLEYRVWTHTHTHTHTVYPKKYAHGFVVVCFVVVMQSFILNSHEVFIHIRQGCFAGTGAIVRLPQCQWSKPDGYGEISQCITTTKHSKAKTLCIFLGIYCIYNTWTRSGPIREGLTYVTYAPSHWLTLAQHTLATKLRLLLFAQTLCSHR